MDEINERVAVLEDALAKHLTDCTARQSAIMDKLEDLSDQLVRYRGFVGGVVFVVGAILSVIGLFKDYLLSHIK